MLNKRERSTSKAKELVEATDDLAYWRAIFNPLECVVVGWTYRTHCQIRLPSGDYLNVDPKIVELVNCLNKLKPG